MAVDAETTTAWMRAFAGRITEQRSALTELDTAIGDGDHGTNLDRGMTKAIETLDANPPPDAGAVLKAVAMALVSSVGGAAGPLYGTLLLQASTALTDPDPVTLEQFAAALRKGTDGVKARGKAQLGDKTMVDALEPAVDALQAADDLDAGLAAAARAAREGVAATVPLQARRGRASYLGERSVGHQDPGATSTALLFETAAETLSG